MIRDSDCTRLATAFHTFLQEYSCSEECTGLGMKEETACSNFVQYYKLVLIVLWHQALEYVFPRQAKATFKQFMAQLQQALPASQRRRQQGLLVDTLADIAALLRQDQGVVTLARQCVAAYATQTAKTGEDLSTRTLLLTRLTLEHLQRSIDQLTAARDHGFGELSTALAAAFSPAAPAGPAPEAVPVSTPVSTPDSTPGPVSTPVPAAIIVPLAAAAPEPLDLPSPPASSTEASLQDADTAFRIILVEDAPSVVLEDEADALLLGPAEETARETSIPAPPPESLFEISEPPPQHLSHGRLAGSPPLEREREPEQTPPRRPASPPVAVGPAPYRTGHDPERRRAERVNAEGLFLFITDSARQLPLTNLSESGLAALHDGWMFTVGQTISVDLMTSTRVLLQDVPCHVVRVDGTVMACTFVDPGKQTRGMLRALVKRLLEIRSRRAARQQT